MDQAAAKQQVVERLKQASTILVTVSKDPSVDQLAACIGMSLFLNKLKKQTTAVFSGEVPKTIDFLRPERTFSHDVDSLRDFIISLDKSKADTIRYKVEDQFVRIYITPYKSSISQKDLKFSEGDLNVELILALGVKDKGQLDEAITAHGRILHDATIISVNAGNDQKASLGQINWQEPTASSLCEMLVSISEAFGTGLIDAQMATAFLTGIVAETDRFSSTKTSPKVMTMAAQLMAAGANQQLIVSSLEPPEPPPEAAKPVQPPKPPPKKTEPGTLNIPHDEPDEEDAEIPSKPEEIHIDDKGNIVSGRQTTTEPPEMLMPPETAEHPLLAPVPQMPIKQTPPKPEPPKMPLPPPPPPAPAKVPPKISKPQPPIVTAPPPMVIAPTKVKPAAVAQTAPKPPVEQAPIPKTPPPLPPPAEPAEKLRGVMDPNDHQRATAPASSANTQKSWIDEENAAPLDPLEQNQPIGALLNHGGSSSNVLPPSLPAGISSATTVFPEPEIANTPTFPAPTVELSPPVQNKPAPQPPAPAPKPSPVAPQPLAVNEARNALEKAVAKADTNPVFELPKPLPTAPPVVKQQPAAPSLTMPVKPTPQTQLSSNDLARPAPPPVPPPLPFTQKTAASFAAPVPVAAGQPVEELRGTLSKPL